MILRLLFLVVLEAMLQLVGGGDCLVQGSIMFACPSSCDNRGHGGGGSGVVGGDRARAIRDGRASSGSIRVV